VRDLVLASSGILLAGVLAVLALPGRVLVPAVAAGGEAPRWLMGAFGDGLGYAGDRYVQLLVAAILLWAVFSWALWGRERAAGRAVWTLIVVLVGLFALAPPLHSLDVFSYISYARLDAVAGLNPYENAPADITGDPAARLVQDFRFTVSAYGPVFTLLSLPLGGTSVGFALWSFKAIAALSVLAIAWLTARIARSRGVPEIPAAAFVALNPLTLAHVVGGAHNDALMVALAMAGVLAIVSARPRVGGGLLVAAAAIKASAAVYAPFAVLTPGSRGRVLTGMVATAIAIALVGLAAFGPSVTEALAVIGDNQATVSYWSVPATLSRITGIDIEVVRTFAVAVYAVAVIALLVDTLRGGDWVRAAGWATFGLLVATAWMVPWYLIWVLPLAAVSRDRRLIVGTVLLTLFQAGNGIAT
jgi:alpha-1,6-mannosyltransferase